LQQTRLKLLIAYSTVAQIGYLFLVFPLAAGAQTWSAIGWSGGVMQILAHAFAKAGMFLSAGLLAEALGHDQIALGGDVGIVGQSDADFSVAGRGAQHLCRNVEDRFASEPPTQVAKRNPVQDRRVHAGLHRSLQIGCAECVKGERQGADEPVSKRILCDSESQAFSAGHLPRIPHSLANITRCSVQIRLNSGT
jgi:hypothetical protein